MRSRGFGFFLAPKFSMMSLLSMTEPLRAANEIAGQEIYRIKYFAESAETTAINGMTVATDSSLPRTTDFDVVIVCASYEPERAATKKALNWLRWLAAHGMTLGSADTGAYILAQAGLLSGEIIALHWVNLPAFREMFPDVVTSSRLIEFSEKRFSCAGATTGIDMMLHLLGKHHGEELMGLRKKEQWLDHAQAMIEATSVAKAAERCGVHPTTAFRWRHRFLGSPRTPLRVSSALFGARRCGPRQSEKARSGRRCPTRVSPRALGRRDDLEWPRG